ncbi:MAG TPA: hypothetical protein DDW65_22690 [Firmicutes bacterium]|jgi:hypothetical protein|nr:hypothetical protein [Bacillota bacterium]
MKKLLVIALSAMMVLAFAAVSMAATTIGGELNFGWYLGQPKALTYDEATDTTTEADTALGDFANAKVTVTADLTDSIKGFAAFKSSDSMDKDFVDEAWVKYTQDWGTVQAGFFEFTTDGDVDIIDSYSTNVKHHSGLAVTGKIADGFSVTGYIAGADISAAESDLEYYYAGGVSYDTDTWGAQVLMATNSADDAATITYANAYYKLGIAKIYFNYADADKALYGEPAPGIGGTYVATDGTVSTVTTTMKGSVGILGASFETDKFYGRAEYEVLQSDVEDDADLDASYGFRLGYKVTDGTKIEYQTKAFEGADAQSYIKLNFVF